MASEIADHPARLKPWQRWLLVSAIALGFAMRLGLAVATGLNEAPEPGSDAEEYDTYAWNVAQGRGYRGMSPDVADQDHLTAYRPPGPSLLFAGVYWVVGHHYAAARIVNCLLGSLSAIFVFRIGRRLYGEVVGLIAAMAYAVYPLAVMQSIDIVSEPLGVFLFLVFLELTLAFAETPGWMTAVRAGFVLGLALLTRANFVFMVPLLVLWGAWQFRGRWLATAQVALILVVAGAVLTPWTIRNYRVFGKFIPFSTIGGSALLMGNNRIVLTDPTRYGFDIWDTKIPEYREALQTAENEVERDARAKRFAIEWLLANKDKWPILAWNKFCRSWTPFLWYNPSLAHRVIYFLTWGPVLSLFCIAFVPTLIGSLRSGSPAWLLHLAVAHFTINCMIFFASIRYRAPIDPICLILASWTVTRLWAALHARSSHSNHTRAQLERQHASSPRQEDLAGSRA